MRPTFLALLTLTCFAVPALPLPGQPPGARYPTTGKTLPVLEPLDSAVLAMMSRHGVPGAALAVTKDGRESGFFAAWQHGAKLFHARQVFSGEGGVIGLAAACAGWSVDFDAVAELGAAIEHEGGGPKAD